MTLSVTDTYTDIATADIYLALKDDWLALSDEKKNEALLNARYFIDENFDIDDIESVADLAAVPDELQMANSLLAYDASTTDLFKRHTTQTIKEKSVQAGKVKSSKKFTAGKENLLPASYSKVKVLLRPLYSNIESVNFLVRA